MSAPPNAQNEGRAPSNLKKLRPVLALAVLGLGYAGYQTYLGRKPYEWSGTVEARTISVGSRAGGRVKEVHVAEGAIVAAGAPLVTIELGDWEAQRLIAKGQLAQAQATLEKLLKGARPEEIDEARARAHTASAALEESIAGSRREQVAAANARLVAAQVSLDKAELDMKRAKALFASGAISQADLDNTTAVEQGAVAQRDAQKKVLEELENGVRQEEIAQARARSQEAKASMQLVLAGSRAEDIEAARGAVAAAQGRLDQVNVMIDELVIKAPRPARVESLDLRPGDILAPNATAATLLETGQLYVRTYVPETQIGFIHEGDHVPITVDSFPGRSFEGVVESINRQGEFSPRNLQTQDERADQVFATRIGLQKGETALRAGMAAFITVPKAGAAVRP